jgi:hypothetical protein
LRIWPKRPKAVVHEVTLAVQVLSSPFAAASAGHCVWLNALIVDQSRVTAAAA